MLPLRRLNPLVAGTGVLVASIMMAVGLIGVPLDTLHLTIGRSAALDRGPATALAMVLLAASSLGLLACLRAVRAPVSGWPERLVAVWAASLTGTALLPGTVAADIMIVVALVALAGAAALMVRRFGDDERWRPAARPLEWLSLGAGGALAVLTYVALPGHRVMVGTVEWSLLGIETAVLAVVAVHLTRITWSLADAPSATPAPAVAAMPVAFTSAPAMPVAAPAMPAATAVPASVAAATPVPVESAPTVVPAPTRSRPVSPARTPARMPARTPAMSAGRALAMMLAPAMKSTSSSAGQSTRVLSRH
ncbi:hypothetical protein OG589_37685 [Sphaerisporangium sp. NBC_01403]|uniref:hypothetical protein n=1 Tax=Sphaerisporangium sp. NBC_01403 TaxID=2903599 RepID=UPI0032527F7D